MTVTNDFSGMTQQAIRREIDSLVDTIIILFDQLQEQAGGSGTAHTRREIEYLEARLELAQLALAARVANRRKRGRVDVAVE